MPGVRAICVSDLHLQARAPIARSSEPDWFAAMARPLEEIAALVEKHDCPVLYAGDIFDRWNASPEVINFALRHLPRGYAVPGQHDLPNHSYLDIKRSAYWTLVEAAHLINVLPGEPILLDNGVLIYGFPWGVDLKPKPSTSSGILNVALIHKYIWTKETGYVGAPDTARVSAYTGPMAGHDVAVFGDNHKGFIQHHKNGPCIINCGGLMRRKVDERKYRPGVGLLLADGTVERHYLDTTEDKFITATEAEEVVGKLLDMSSFVDGLHGLEANDALDFTAAITRFIQDNDIPKRVAEIILQSTEGGV